MSKAQIKCMNCEYEWEYSGLSCESAYCPNCSKEIIFDEPGTVVEIISKFGFASQKNNNTVESYGGRNTRDRTDEDYPEKEMEDELIDDLGL
jgi:hypothetical protein